MKQEGIGEDISYYQDITTDRLSRALESLKSDPKATKEDIKQIENQLAEKRSNNVVGLRIFESIITDSKVRSEIRNMIAGHYTAEDINALILEEDTTGEVSLSGRINRDIISYLNTRKKAELKKLQELGIYRPIGEGKVEMRGLSVDAVGGTSVADVESAVEEYIWNSTAAYIEQTKLLFGDLGFFASPEEAFKRFSMYNSTKKISVTGKGVEGYINKAYPRLDGKIINRNIINTVIFEDVKATIPKEYVEVLENIFTNSLLQDQNSKGKKVFTDDNKTLNTIGKIKLAGLISPYLNMEEADGQGYITLDEYRDLMVRAGDWLPSHEAVYNKAILGEELSHREIAYLPPLKTQYTGPLLGSSKSGDYSAQGLNVPTGYKHSLLPLIPSLFKEGSQMQSLIAKMQDNQWGIAQFRSGNKFGTVVDLNTGKTNEFYREIEQGKEKKWVINTDDLITQTIDYKYMGIQQDTPVGIKIEGTVGTQQRKIIL